MPDLYEKGNGGKWLDGLTYPPRFRECLNTLRDEALITRELYKEIDAIYGRLNKYVHPHAKAFACSQEDYCGCPVDGFYSDKLINEWFDTFQNIMEWILNWYTFQVPEILEDEKTKLWLDTAKFCIFDKEE